MVEEKVVERLMDHIGDYKRVKGEERKGGGCRHQQDGNNILTCMVKDK